MRYKNLSNFVSRSLPVTLVLAALLAATSCGGAPPKETPTALFQVGMLTNGPLYDNGYNQSHNQGRLDLEQALAGKVKVTVVENTPETADAERTMEQLIGSGARLIIGTSFGYQDSAVTVAARHPDVRFLQAWGTKHAPNIGSYSAKMYEAWYLMGILAGKTTKTNKLGIVAAHPIPPMKWQMDAYVLGARSVNPKVTATVIYINHWFDPVLSSQAAEALINNGHDVLTGVLDNSVGVAQTAERRGVWLIGHNTDLSTVAPTRCLASTRWLWGKLYEHEVRAMMDNSWKGGSDFAGGLKEGFVGITKFSSAVPPEVQREVETARDRIVSGELSVYRGPIKDNTGKEVVPAGKVLTHDEIMGVNWQVAGLK